MKFMPVQVQYSAVLCSVIKFNEVQCSLMCDVVPYRADQRSEVCAVKCSPEVCEMQSSVCNALQRKTVQ